MAKKKARYYPVVKQAPISAGASANTLVDGARFLSVLNRRLYRFGRYYSMKVDVRPDYAGQAIEVFVLRDDWAVQKSFQLAYQHYLDNTMDEREALGPSQVARWEDFRIADGLNLVGGINQSRPVLHGETGGASILNSGEFQLSNVVDDNNVQRTFTWSPIPQATEYSVLLEYDKTANTPADPSQAPADLAYSGISSNYDEATGDALRGDGNLPPYDNTGVNQLRPWVRVAVLGSGAQGVQRLSTGFFTAPCGLILLKGFTETSEAYSVQIEAKSGDYKGVHAPSMIEVATVNRKRKVVK